MKLKHLFTMLFLVFMCVIALNITPEAEAAPAKPSISTPKRSYATGEAVTFNISASGNLTTNLWIYRVDGQWQTTYTGVGATASVTFGWAGYYRALVQTWNTDNTEAMSDYVYFYIGPPQSVTMTGNRAVVAQGQSITYTITSDDPGSVHVFHIYSDDANINPVYHEYWTGVTGTSYTYNGKNKAGNNLAPGNYYAQVYTANDVNGTNSNKVWFTVVGGTASISLTNSNSVTSGGIAHGNVTYTVKLSTAVNGSVNNANFKVVASNGSETLTLCTVTNGAITTENGASVSGSIGTIGKNSSASITLTVNSDNSAFDRNSTYTVQVQAGNVALTGLDAGNGTKISFAASGTHQFKTTSGSATLSWTSNITSGSIVEGKYTYTVTFHNGTNHSINGIDFTVKTGNTAIVTVTNGSITTHSCASVSPTSLGTINSGKDATLTITIDVSKLSDKTGYTFSLAGGGCSATGIYGSTSTYAVSTTGSGSHSITTAGGSVSASGASNISSGKVVEGTYTYTITLTNNTNHTVTGIDFVVKNGSTTIVTVSNGSITIANGINYVSVDPTSLGDVASGKSASLTITIDTTKLTDGSNHTFTVGNVTCSAKGLAGDNKDYGLTGTLSYSHSITVRSGGVSMSWTPSISTGQIVEGTYTYKITFTNSTNHSITGIDYTFKNGSTTIVTIKDGAVTVASGINYVTVSTNSLGDVATGKSVELTITIDTTKLTDGSNHTFAVSGGTCNATGIAGSNSGIALSTTFSGSHAITVRSGGVTMTWTPSISSGKVVEGTYYYDITFTNGTNHTITGIDFTLKIGNTSVVTVSNGAVTANVSYAAVNKETLGNLASGASVTLRVTIDASKMTDGSNNTFTLANGSSNATGIAGSNASIELKPSTNSYTHAMTVRSGDITVGLTSTTVNNNGVAEGDVNYTITLNNGTNHTLKDISFTLQTSAGEKLLTVNNDGTITVHNSTLVKNGGSVSGSLTNLASGGTVTISGIVIDGKADVLDSVGNLILTASGSAKSSDVVGSAADVNYGKTTDTFTIMVRHDVNLLVQSGVITNIDAATILAAMDKSDAEIYAGIDAISAVTVTDINGNTITKDGFGSNGSNLTINLTNAYSEYIIKVTYSGGTILVPIQVTTIDAGKDATKVLDYGLPVSISKDILLGDVRLTGGAYTNIPNAIKGFSAAMPGEGALTLKGKFGSFSFANNAFSYVTNQFMTGEDVAYIVILVGDATGEENVDYVNVYKKMSFIPSNVIYYEDTLIGSITYPVDFDLTELGELVATGESLEQDLPETGNMGFDDGSYANSQDVTISGESVHKVPIYNKEVTVSFTVTGTGFELISRVNAEDAATILVMVRPQGGTDNDWVYYPVITRFDPNGNGNAEVYQVPVFRLNNGDFKTYEVQVVGLPVQDYNENGDPIPGTYKPSYIYIDGIRVYNPLGLDNPLTNNYGVEQGAEFTNLRDLILAGQGMVADYTNGFSNFTTGSYYYVANEGTYTAALGSINELGAIGANNEILVRKSAGNHIIVLKVQETVDGKGLLQIGIHDIHDGKFDGTSETNLASSVSYNTTDGWATLKADFKSGTEQYYNIDLSKCPSDGNGYKLVILQVDSGFVSFTNVKHNNITFGEMGKEVLKIYTEPGFFFDEQGNMCSKDENGNVTVHTPADQIININTLNDILAASNVENETV